MGNSKGKGTPLHKVRAAAPGAQLAEHLAPEPPAEFHVERPPVHHSREITDAMQDQAMREWAAGRSLPEIAAKFDTSRNYLRGALLRRFGSREQLLNALEGLVLENAVTSQMIAQEKMPELSAAQAVFAGKLLVETMGNLNEQRTKAPKTINFREFKNLGDSLREIRTDKSASAPTF